MKINKAKEYIKLKLNEFIKSFPKTSVRYEYDIDANVHSIEVLPQKIYTSDKNFINWEINFIDDFISKFPYQNICFISKNSIMGIEKAEFEIIGEKYIDENIKNSNSIIKKLIAKKSKKEINYRLGVRG